MTLTQFLLARIAEDEEAARNVEQSAIQAAAKQREAGWTGSAMFPDSHRSPAWRALAECRAKRRIVGLHESVVNTTSTEPLDVCSECGSGLNELDWNTVPWPCQTIRAVATVYVDHPDFNQAWLYDVDEDE